MGKQIINNLEAVFFAAMGSFILLRGDDLIVASILIIVIGGMLAVAVPCIIEAN